MSSSDRARFEASVRIPFAVGERAATGAAAGTVVLLHGFRESGSRMLRRLEGVIPAEQKVLSPDAPFPQVLELEGSGPKLGFSWYFYDPSKDEYVLDMEVALECVLQLIREKALPGMPVTLVGFSMGGYLAPFVAEACPQVTRVVGIGCRFLDEELKGRCDFELHGIHGALDDRVDPAKTRESHAMLVERGARGTFTMLEGVGHKLTDEVRAVLARILSRPAPLAK